MSALSNKDQVIQTMVHLELSLTTSSTQIVTKFYGMTPVPSDSRTIYNHGGKSKASRIRIPSNLDSQDIAAVETLASFLHSRGGDADRARSSYLETRKAEGKQSTRPRKRARLTHDKVSKRP